VTAALVLAGALIFSPTQAQAAESGCAVCGDGNSGTVSPGPGGIDVGESGGGVSGGGPGIGAPGGYGPIYEYAYTPACADNRPLSSTDGFVNTIDCPGAHQCPDPRQMGMYVARRVVDGTAPGPWTFAGSACLGPQQLLSYDPAAAAAFVLDYFKHLPLPEPGVHVQPSGRPLVNLPTIVYADQPPAGHWVVDHAPFPTITITGTPHWQVDAGGTVTTSDTPGRPYDGTDPRAAPGHYLTHTFTRPASAATITVTVTWSATFTLGNDPTPIPMNGTVSRSSTLTVAVDEAGSVLTDNS
jgi:hypothetical protein